MHPLDRGLNFTQPLETVAEYRKHAAVLKQQIRELDISSTRASPALTAVYVGNDSVEQWPLEVLATADMVSPPFPHGYIKYRWALQPAGTISAASAAALKKGGDALVDELHLRASTDYCAIAALDGHPGLLLICTEYACDAAESRDAEQLLQGVLDTNVLQQARPGQPFGMPKASLPGNAVNEADRYLVTFVSLEALRQIPVPHCAEDRIPDYPVVQQFYREMADTVYDAQCLRAPQPRSAVSMR